MTPTSNDNLNTTIHFKPIVAQMPLVDSMSLILRKYYDLKSMEHTVTSIGHKIYRTHFDERFMLFIHEAFDIDKHFFNRLKFLSDFISMVNKDRLYKHHNEVIMAYTSEIFIFMFGDIFSVTIRKNETIENVSFKLFDLNIGYNSDKKGFNLEYHFKNRQLELHRTLILKGFKTFSHIYKVCNSSMTDAIKSVLEHDSVTLLSDEECCKISKKFKSFGNYYKFSLSDMNLFLPHILNKQQQRDLYSLLSLMFFESKLDNPEIVFTDNLLEFEVTQNFSKFKDVYSLYQFMFGRVINNSFVQDLSITTESEVFHYSGPITFDSNYPFVAKGYDDIYNLIKDRILDKIAAKLMVDKAEINNNSLVLYSMLSI
jgi:hypothetical protein